MDKVEIKYTGKLISCRAKVSKNCQDDTKEIKGMEMYEDGTWNGESIVCTPCYIDLMPLSPSKRLLADEIEPTIRLYHDKSNL
jgi:hypothetical protein